MGPRQIELISRLAQGNGATPYRSGDSAVIRRLRNRGRSIMRYVNRNGVHVIIDGDAHTA
jgi:hypothetical protein